MDVLQQCILTLLLAVLVDCLDFITDYITEDTVYNPFVYLERPGRDEYLETYYPQYGYKPYSAYSPNQDGMCSEEFALASNWGDKENYANYMSYLRGFRGNWFDENIYSYAPLIEYSEDGEVVNEYGRNETKYNEYWKLGVIKYGKKGNPIEYAIYYENEVVSNPPSSSGPITGCCWQFKKRGGLPKRKKLKKPKKHTRCEYRQLTKDERQSFHDAMNKLKDLKIYDNIVKTHRCANSPYAHGGASFLPWHREYLFRLERALFEHGYTGPGLPYWDSTLDFGLPIPSDSAIWTAGYLGNAHGDVVSGFAAGWAIDTNECTSCAWCGNTLRRGLGWGQLGPCFLMSDFDINYVMSKKCFKEITCNTDCKFESDHAGVHSFVGGHMGTASCAPHDPVFFLHHAFIDCIWEWFRENSQVTPIDLEYPSWINNGDDVGSNRPSPTFKGFLGYEWDAPMYPFWGLWNGHGISKFYQAYYSCKERPMGCRSDSDCKSDILWCDTSIGRCRAKIREGGRCDSLPDNACDGTECGPCTLPACYESYCECLSTPCTPPNFSTTEPDNQCPIDETTIQFNEANPEGFLIKVDGIPDIAPLTTVGGDCDHNITIAKWEKYFTVMDLTFNARPKNDVSVLVTVAFVMDAEPDVLIVVASPPGGMVVDIVSGSELPPTGLPGVVGIIITLDGDADISLLELLACN